MRHRIFASWGAVTFVMVVMLGAPVLVAGQARSGPPATTIDPDAAIKAAAEAVKAAAAPANWTPPRTPWGDPDLQGYWLSASYTPLQRPPALAGKPFFTEEEALAAFKKAVEGDAAPFDPRVVHYNFGEYGMDSWQSPVRPNRRTSLIVDPPDGRIPPLTKEAAARKAQMIARGLATLDMLGGTAEDRPAWETTGPQKRETTLRPVTDVQLQGLSTRCIADGAPPKIGGSYNSEFQILQTPGYVVIIAQRPNDPRIIPLDGRPHLPNNVGLWVGDARGRWEGDTLVVDTTNFHPQRDWQGSSDGLHLVERFTRVGPKTIRFEFTADDPTTWTRPWSAENLVPQIEPPIYEWACHEQNYGLINVVKGAQAREAEEAAKKGLTK